MRLLQNIAVYCLLTVFVTAIAAKVIESSPAKDSSQPLANSANISTATESHKIVQESENAHVNKKTSELAFEESEKNGNKGEKIKSEAVKTSQSSKYDTSEKSAEESVKSEEMTVESTEESQSASTKGGQANPEKVQVSSEKTEPDMSNTKGKEKTEMAEPETVKPDAEVTERVNYAGVKVLRVIIQNKEQKKLLKQLERSGDISTWVGNKTAVDIVIRKANVIDFFKDRKLVYDVVIDDLQKAIDEENPPLPEDEWSELEGRKVDLYNEWTGNGFLSPFHYWMTSHVSQITEDIEYDDNEFSELRRKKKTKRKKKGKKKKKKKTGHRMTWDMYHRTADIMGYIDYLTVTYPDKCSQETIGYSVEGKPLKVLKISSENADRAMWVDSGIHAREWITPATSTYIISQMLENGDGTHGVNWYFLPLVNPDGYEHSHTVDRLWRKNRSNSYKGPCAGTDLNRNFGYRWGGQGASQISCRETYAGSGPFSEPETDAIRKFVLKKSNEIKAYVSLHSYGQYILYPWGYDRKVPPDYSDLHRVGRAMAQAMKQSGGQTYTVGSSAATLYPAAGGSDDWAKAVPRIKYTYTVELRDTGRHGFVLPAQYIQPTAKEAYAALKVLASEVLQL